MIVTAWNNGKKYATGAGYGVKIKAEERDRFFKKSWKNVLLDLKRCHYFLDTDCFLFQYVANHLRKPSISLASCRGINSITFILLNILS